MSERMFHTPLEPHPSLSIYPTLFSGHKYDRHKDPSQIWVVYEEEPKLGYCDTGWSLSSESIFNNSPSQERSRATSALLKSKNIALGEIKLSLGFIQVTQNDSGKWSHCFDYHPHTFLPLTWIPHWCSLGKKNILMYWWQDWKTNIWLLALVNFPFHVTILTVKSPFTLTIISRGAPLVLLVLAGRGVCCQIFGI